MRRAMLLATMVALLAGSASTAAATDIDIKSMKATPRVRLSRLPEIQISANFTNASAVAGDSVTAILQGDQNFQTVHLDTVKVYDDPGNGHTAFDFDPYTPFMAGIIEWTLTVLDDDIDEDVATDSTLVIWRVRMPGANLTGADLRGENLSGVDITGADVRGADFSGADLSDAVGLGQTIGDATTIYSNRTDFTGSGFDPQAAGWTLVDEAPANTDRSLGEMKSLYRTH
jgi:hypothetical protein